ncbi:PHP domain-containing protein [Ktedonosporobacter rubrisoli]|nr:PHP-associated domain-containing protein [Ktedonosporobacter rubrisoli]
MLISKQNSVIEQPAMTPAGTAMLHKRQRMTPQLAHSFGKHGQADLHMHSTYSDGSGTIKEILEHVQHNTNLDVIAITDHDVIEGSLRARDLWQQGSYRFDFIVGEEISTKEGHLLALFIEKRIAPGMSMERSIELIHEQGGLAVIAHPLHRLFRHSCKRAVMDRIHASKEVWFDGIETWNASFCGIYANQVAMQTNREIYGLAELGNSDAHAINSIGSGHTWFEGKSAQDIRSAIARRMTAPGGKLWDVQDYVDWLRYRMSGRQAQQAEATVVPLPEKAAQVSSLQQVR